MLLTFTMHPIQPAAKKDLNTSKICKTMTILHVMLPQMLPPYLYFCKHYLVRSKYIWWMAS